MIRYLITDVDGTLTDGTIYIGENSEVCKPFFVRDGLGLLQIQREGIEVIILTSRQSKIVQARCAELGIHHIYQNVKDKKAFILDWMNCQKVLPEEVAYIGDDVNDLEAIRLFQCSACPIDAVDRIRDTVTYIMPHPGGKGAVRDFCELLLRLRN